jgi:hypothetical protein
MSSSLCEEARIRHRKPRTLRTTVPRRLTRIPERHWVSAMSQLGQGTNPLAREKNVTSVRANEVIELAGPECPFRVNQRHAELSG